MTDTSPEVAALQLDLFRRMPPARRLSLAINWSNGIRSAIRATLRQEHPQATAAEMKLLFAERWLGADLAATVYSPRRSDG